MVGKFFSWGVGDGRIGPLQYLRTPKIWMAESAPQVQKNFCRKIVLSVVVSNYNQAHRDQRPQISRNTCLTRIFWKFDRKKFFFYPNRLKVKNFSSKKNFVLQRWDRLQTTTNFVLFHVVYPVFPDSKWFLSSTYPKISPPKGTLMVKIGFWNKNFLEGLKILGILPWLTLQ